VQVFEGHLDQEEGQLVSGASTASEFVLAVGQHAQELQKDVRTAIEVAAVRAGEALQPALAGLAAGEDLSVGYPAPFVNGSGSSVDKYEADIHKAVGKTYASLNKRLAKTAKLAEKQGVGFTWRLVPPVEFFAYEANPAGGSQDASTPLRIDATFGAGELDQDGDDILVVSGISNADAGDVSLDLFGTDLIDNTFGVAIDEETGRWSVAIAAAPEGNYTLVINQGAGASVTGVSFGLR
jgi:hypothetical protein